MNGNKSATRWLMILVVAALPWSAAWAQWDLDSSKSAVNFVSIKNNSVGETHSFTRLVGFIGESGNVQLTIDLDSVATAIEVRDERVRELLFETANFPAATITAQVNEGILAAVAAGGVVTVDLPVSLNLHGVKKNLIAPMTVVGEGDRHLRVFTARPILLDAAQFGLEGGVNALREIAGLQAISNVVPVTLQLRFIPAPVPNTKPAPKSQSQPK